jgi:hypothetical protein
MIPITHTGPDIAFFGYYSFILVDYAHFIIDPAIIITLF